jgi:hypothetical protein
LRSKCGVQEMLLCHVTLCPIIVFFVIRPDLVYRFRMGFSVWDRWPDLLPAGHRNPHTDRITAGRISLAGRISVSGRICYCFHLRLNPSHRNARICYLKDTKTHGPAGSTIGQICYRQDLPTRRISLFFSTISCFLGRPSLVGSRGR